MADKALLRANILADEISGNEQAILRRAGFEDPRFKLDGQVFTAETRLHGDGIDQTHRIRFRNLERGDGLELIE